MQRTNVASPYETSCPHSSRPTSITMFADFGRFDNSPLVRPTARLESTLRLRRYQNISPWVLVAANKRARTRLDDAAR